MLFPMFRSRKYMNCRVQVRTLWFSHCSTKLGRKRECEWWFLCGFMEHLLMDTESTSHWRVTDPSCSLVSYIMKSWSHSSSL